MSKKSYIIYGLYIAESGDGREISHKPISKDHFTEHIVSTINCYNWECIEADDPEVLYLYIDARNLNGAYIGYDEAKSEFDEYVRTPLIELLGDKADQSGNEPPVEAKIKHFVAANFPDSCFKQ